MINFTLSDKGIFRKYSLIKLLYTHESEEQKIWKVV